MIRDKIQYLILNLIRLSDIIEIIKNKLWLKKKK